MYRVFCESYKNYISQFDHVIQKDDEYRYRIAKPFELIGNLENYNVEKSYQSDAYKELSDLLFYIGSNLDRYPKLRAFLWTLESRGIKGQYYGITPIQNLEEQTKLANTFLSLLYWDNTEN